MRKTHRYLIERNYKQLILLIAIPVLILPVLFSALGPSKRVGDVKFPAPPRFAYMIYGGAGELSRVKRLLLAVYHPWNCYLIRLELEKERNEFIEFLEAEKVIRDFGNVRLVSEVKGFSRKGPSEIAVLLQGIAILLREFKDWNWFINLSANDYPLMSQDDILHIFSYIPKEFNFIEHTSNLGWREYQRARPMIVDPSLHNPNKTILHSMKEKRSMPSSFKLFVGSSWVVLNRSFLKFCIQSWDNLPRMLLMYFTNFLYSSESYFHTVICNSNYFQNTTVNSDLRFMLWDNPPKLLPINLTLNHFNPMAESGSLFAHPVDDLRVLDRIDEELLGRRANDGFAPGGWCLGKGLFGRDKCGVYGDKFVLRPSGNVRKLEKLLVRLLESGSFRNKQCK